MAERHHHRAWGFSDRTNEIMFYILAVALIASACATYLHKTPVQLQNSAGQTVEMLRLDGHFPFGSFHA